MNEFGSKLRELRERNGRTQQEIADHFYVSAATVSRWESGTRYPDLFTAKKLADYYGTSLDEILGEKEIDEYHHKKAGTDEKTRICLYTMCSIVFLIRLAGIFLFPQVHDGSMGAKLAEGVDLISTITILIMLVRGVIMSVKAGEDPLFDGRIVFVFFLAEMMEAFRYAGDFTTLIVYALPPLVCLVLVFRFYFQGKTEDYRYLEGMLIAYLFFSVIACFLQSQTYAYTSTSFVTRYRFLWSFVNPLGTACLMILSARSVYRIYRNRKRGE